MVYINILCALAVLVAVISWAFFIADIHTYSKRKMRDKDEHNNKN